MTAGPGAARRQGARTRPARGGRRRRGAGARAGLLAALLVAAGVAPGCAALGGRLDVPPGHHVVLGGVDLTRFDEREALLEIVREDGTYHHDLRVPAAPGPFAITLPPGRYRVTRVRVLDGRQAVPDRVAYDLRVAFDVGAAPTVYIGTLRLVRDFGDRLRVEVGDEYERAVPALRARYPGIREPVARALMRSA